MASRHRHSFSTLVEYWVLTKDLVRVNLLYIFTIATRLVLGVGVGPEFRVPPFGRRGGEDRRRGIIQFPGHAVLLYVLGVVEITETFKTRNDQDTTPPLHYTMATGGISAYSRPPSTVPI